MRTQRDTGAGAASVVMAPTLYEYDAFGHVTCQLMALEDMASQENSPVQRYAYGVERREEGVFLVTSQTHYNAQGEPLVAVTES